MSPTQEEYDALDELHRKDHARADKAEALAVKAIAAHLNCHIVKADLEKAEAALAEIKLDRELTKSNPDWSSAYRIAREADKRAAGRESESEGPTRREPDASPVSTARHPAAMCPAFRQTGRRCPDCGDARDAKSPARPHTVVHEDGSVCDHGSVCDNGCLPEPRERECET